MVQSAVMRDARIVMVFTIFAAVACSDSPLAIFAATSVTSFLICDRAFLLQRDSSRSSFGFRIVVVVRRNFWSRSIPYHSRSAAP